MQRSGIVKCNRIDYGGPRTTCELRPVASSSPPAREGRQVMTSLIKNLDSNFIHRALLIRHKNAFPARFGVTTAAMHSLHAQTMRLQAFTSPSACISCFDATINNQIYALCILNGSTVRGKTFQLYAKCVRVLDIVQWRLRPGPPATR